jgi:hypothetical protein
MTVLKVNRPTGKSGGTSLPFVRQLPYKRTGTETLALGWIKQHARLLNRYQESAGVFCY